jgi:hypothetical protein
VIFFGIGTRFWGAWGNSSGAEKYLFVINIAKGIDLRARV